MTSPGALQDPYPLHPPVVVGDLTVSVPGSKSITNRALVCAALAEGPSVLGGALDSDDTRAMLGCLDELGIEVNSSEEGRRLDVDGAGGPPPREGAVLDARSSGTTSRFVAPLAVSGGATVVLDGTAQLRARPMGDLWAALEALGGSVEDLGEPGHLPAQLSGGRRGLEGGEVQVRGDASSQFLSGLLLSAPVMRRGLAVEVVGDLVSVPYVEMTLAVMEEFGAAVERSGDLHHIRVAPGAYQGRRYHVEPDASAASYFFAAAALLGTSVTIDGLGTASVQGDVAFVDVLEAMGARVQRSARSITVTGTGTLRGVEVDMADISDTAQTLAAVAVFAEGPTVVRGIGFIRGKETDRIAAVVTELQRLGIDATEDPDGFTIRPGVPSPGVVQTYDDHRMAMSFALLGLRAEGIAIADPGCVAKTFPGFWQEYAALEANAR